MIIPKDKIKREYDLTIHVQEYESGIVSSAMYGQLSLNTFVCRRILHAVSDTLMLWQALEANDNIDVSPLSGHITLKSDEMKEIEKSLRELSANKEGKQ